MSDGSVPVPAIRQTGGLSGDGLTRLFSIENERSMFRGTLTEWGRSRMEPASFLPVFSQEKETKASRKEKNFTIVRCFYIDF